MKNNESLIIEAPGIVKITEAPMPVCGEGEALLELLYGGLCGSDLNAYRGTYAYAIYPNVPGHEFSARILEIKGKDSSLRPGDIVTANPYFNCGHCYSCRRGMVNCCVDNQTMGVQRQGAFSRYIVMPVERLYPVGTLDPKLAALTEPFCIGYHGMRQADIRASDRVLVVGAGTIGIFAMLSAKSAGAKVYITDVAADKLAMAQEMGADGIILNDTPEHFSQACAEITQGDGFDAAIEAVGLPSTFQMCIDCTAHGGRISLIGISKKHIDLDFNLIQRKELNIHGSRNALKADFLSLIDVIQSGRFPLDRMITNLYPFASAPRAFSEFDKNAGSMLKVMLQF